MVECYGCGVGVMRAAYAGSHPTGRAVTEHFSYTAAMVARDKARRIARDKDGFEAKPRDSMQEWVETCLAALPNLEVRRMFGGAGIYAGGTMFGILHKGRVYLKTDERTRAALVERGAGPFRGTKNLADWIPVATR